MVQSSLPDHEKLSATSFYRPLKTAIVYSFWQRRQPTTTARRRKSHRRRRRRRAHTLAACQFCLIAAEGKKDGKNSCVCSANTSSSQRKSVPLFKHQQQSSGEKYHLVKFGHAWNKLTVRRSLRAKIKNLTSFPPGGPNFLIPPHA